MKKLRHWILVWGLLFIFADTTTANEIVNERPLLRGTELEKYWRLDCSSTVAEILAQLATAQDGTEINWDGINIKNLELCAFIYHTPGTSRTQHCPDYRRALTELQRLQDKNSSESNTAIDHRIRKHLIYCQ